MTAKVIRFGLDAVRDVGEEAARSIAANAPYSSFVDFLERNPGLSSTAVTSLIAAGALDRFGSRAGLTAALPAVSTVVLTTRALAAIGHRKTFLSGFHVHAGGEDWPDLDLLAAEHHALGLYVSGHPTDAYDLNGYWSLNTLGSAGHDVELPLAGLVIALDRKVSRRGEPWAVMTLEDAGAAVQVLWFPSSYVELHDVEPGVVVGVIGRVSRKEGLAVIGQECEVLEPTGPAPRIVRVDVDEFDLTAAKDQLAALPVDRPRHLEIAHGDSVTTFLVRT